MKISTRIIMTLYILCVISFCALIIWSAFDFSVQYNMRIVFSNIFSGNAWTYVWVGGSAVFIIMGLYLILFRKSSGEAGNVLLTTTSGGRAYISTRAIDEVAHRFLKGVEGIVINSVRTKCAEPSTVVVEVDISARPGTIIVDVTNTISSELNQHIEKFTGIEVKNVAIKVSPLKVPNA